MSSVDKNVKKTKDAIRNVLKNGKTRVYSDDGHCIMTLGKNENIYEGDDFNLDDISDTRTKSKSTWLD